MNKSTLIAILSGLSLNVLAAPPVEVVASNIDLFLSASSNPIPVASYTNGTHPIYGSMQFLRSDQKAYTYNPGTKNPYTGSVTVQTRLLGALNFASKTASSSAFAGFNHQKISENNVTPGQCVAFAKSMTSSLRTTTDWRAGRALSNIFINGQAVSGTANNLLVPGSVIAYFGGKSTYGANTSNPHVAVVLSVAQQGTTITGLNVVDQNGATSATIGGVVTTTATASSGGTIAKHFLPWSSTSTLPQLSAKNYNVVAQCATGNTCN